MKNNELYHYKHRKYRLVNTYDSFSEVLDLKTNLLHRTFKLEDHQVGDEFYLFENKRVGNESEKIFFRYSILNLYKPGETYTFDITGEIDNLFFLTTHKNVQLAAPISFKDSADQIQIDLEVEKLNLDLNRVKFKNNSTQQNEVWGSTDYSVFEEKTNYSFEIEKTFLSKSSSLIMIVSYKEVSYFIHVPSHLSKAAFKSPVLAHIASNKNDEGKYIRLSRKYISETLYNVGEKHMFTIENQIQDFENGLSYWIVRDNYGNKIRYYPEGDFTFNSELAQLSEGDKINLSINAITDKGHVKLVSEIKDWDEKSYLVETVFEAIGFLDQVDKYFYNYVDVLDDNDEDEIESLENSYLEQYEERNNLWIFSYLSFLDVEIYNELDKGNFEVAKTLIKIYLNIEKWILEESDYLTNFSAFKVANIIYKAESKIVKLKARLEAINIFLEGEDREFIEELNSTLARTPYLSGEKREVLKQFLSISQYFIGDSDFKELSDTIFLLIERNLISSEDRWVYIKSIGSFIYRIRQRIAELISDGLKPEKPKELELLISFNYLLVYLNVIDNNPVKATVTSVALLRNLSLYYDKVEYLDLAIKLLLHNGYIEPNVFKHKNIFDLDPTQLHTICVFNYSEEQSFVSAGNILYLEEDFIVIPRNLYNGQSNCHLKTIAKLKGFDLYVKSYYDLNPIEDKDEINIVLKNAIQALRHRTINTKFRLNKISYKKLDISYEKTYSGIVKKLLLQKRHCYLTCIIDGVEMDTLLHINSFHKNRIGTEFIEECIRTDDEIRFRVIEIEVNRIVISPSFLVDNHAKLVLEENEIHYGKVMNVSKNASKVLTEKGLVVTIGTTSYKKGDVLKLKLAEYIKVNHTFISHDYEICNKIISKDKKEIFREYLVTIGVIIPKDAQVSLKNEIEPQFKATRLPKYKKNSYELRSRAITLIHSLEQRLKYLTEPKEIAVNYFFIISIAGVIKNAKSFEYSNKLNNLTKIISLEYSHDIELLDTVIEEKYVGKSSLERLQEENSTVALLKYMDTDLIDLPVSIPPSSPQYKLKKLIESVNLLKTYELNGKLTEVLKKIVVHELYSTTLQVNHSNIKELESVLTDDLGVEEEMKQKRIITNLGAESKYKEFKSSLFYAASIVPQKDVILRTICGFLNAYDGKGSLFIGVDDSGKIKGLKDDLNYKENIDTLDKYLNHLQSKIVKAFPKEINALLEYKFFKSKHLDYLEIRIPSHNKPISYKDEFYQRQGVQTRILKGEDITDFILRKSNNTTKAMLARTHEDSANELEKEEINENTRGKSLIGIGNERPKDFYEELAKGGELQFTKYAVSEDNLLGYLYIFHDNTYALSATKKEEYKFEVPITEKYKFGHLLFCYDNACVNKVDVRSIINKSFHTIYKNAVGNHGKLMRIIKSLPKKQIGIETKSFNKNYVKLYDIDKISEHRIMELKGSCLVQEDFDEVVGYYYNESLPASLKVFKRESRQGFGGETSKYLEEYKLLLDTSK